MNKILIVEDHPIFRRGVKDILAAHRFVIGEAEDANRAGQLLRKEPWDVMILDISLPGKTGLEFIGEVKVRYPKLPVLVLSVHAEDQYAIRMLKAGASGYLTKDRTAEDLVGALTKLLRGQKYLSETLADRVLDELNPRGEQAEHHELSNREFEILRLIAQGVAPRDISRKLRVSPSTVSTYRVRVLNKLRLKNNAQLVQYALANNLIES